jgi:peptidoglycan/xylan/chitin deacetylase (PgdA/CDA1 family)
VSALPSGQTSERWPLPPAILISAGLHAAVALAWLLLPAAWPWWLAVLVLNHAVIVAAGLWPRSSWLGPNITRLPVAAAERGEVAITIDDGPDPEVTPAVLDVLQAAGAVATFFCIGQRAQAHPQLLREIVARGHSVQNHSFRHDHRFSLSGPAAFARELRAAQEVFERITGLRPSCFRAPAGLRNPFLAAVLQRLGLHLVSWTRRGYDTRERDACCVLERLTRDLAAGDILLLHDGHVARSAAGVPVVLEVLPALLQRLREAGLKPVTLPHALQGVTP